MILLPTRLQAIPATTLIRSSAAALAILVVVTVPMVYGLVGYWREAQFLLFKADLAAERASLFFAGPTRNMSQRQADRLASAVQLRSSQLRPISQRIIDTTGGVVLHTGEDPGSPLFSRTAPIIVDGTTIGLAEVTGTLPPLVKEIAAVSLVTLALGIAAYFVFAVLPLRAIGRTLADLESANANSRIENATFAAALDKISQGLCLFDHNQKVIVANRRYAEIYGLKADQVGPGTRLRDILEARTALGLFSEPNRQERVEEILSTFDRPESRIITLADGRFISVIRKPMPGGGMVSTHEDITERQKLIAQVEERTSLLEAIVENFPGGIAFLDKDLRVVLGNETVKQLLDLPNSLFANSPTPLDDILRFNAGRNEYGTDNAERRVAKFIALAKGRKPFVFERERPNGVILETRGVPLNDGALVLTYTDVTERRRTEAKIAHMARHDALTGLPNRTLFSERLAAAFKCAERGELVAAHLLDLDGFKAVNDGLGHPAGDCLLAMVAERLRALLRRSDTIARVGGDEFAILQVGVRDRGEAAALALRAIDAVSAPYQIGQERVVVGTSVGIAISPTDGLAGDEVLRKADCALYQAKSEGRGAHRFFDSEMEAEARARKAIASDLRRGLKSGEFELHYQPVIDLRSGAITALEALVRWRHPDGGLKLAGDFIALAEELGVMSSLGERILEMACTTAASWPEHVVSVNVSPSQFRARGFLRSVSNALAISKLPAERLQLEIAEAAVTHDIDAAIATLYELRGQGVRIAIDAFGTGSSSLGLLQAFRFDRLKIDRSLVNEMPEGTIALNIVRSLAGLAAGLGTTTIAQGVERQAQLDALKAEGIAEAQGFLFGGAVPANEIRSIIASMPRTLAARPAA
jgi:diguanylate cyclase (GGDEF)-like protein